MTSGRFINSPERMIEAVRRYGIIPLFRGSVPGWSIQELTAPGCWFDDDEGMLGPWDWKVDVVREGDIAYGKFLGGKAAFATLPWYRELMRWRRSLERYRVALGEDVGVGAGKGRRAALARRKPATNAEKLMKIYAPVALKAVREAGALGSKELRLLCGQAVTDAQIKSLGPRYTPLLTPAPKKNVMDSIVQFLQMGTWIVVGDITRVYRGPNLTYNGWQLASNTTPEELFGEMAPAGGGPTWARRFEEATAAHSPAIDDGNPTAARGRIIAHVQSMCPGAGREALEKLI